MTGRESLWHLIYGLKYNTYDIKTFCGEFTKIFDTQLDYNELTLEENKEFYDLCEMTARFSEDEGELLIHSMYYGEKQIREKANKIIENMRQ